MWKPLSQLLHGSIAEDSPTPREGGTGAPSMHDIEVDIPAYLRRRASFAVLEWTVAPPRPRTARNYYVRFKDAPADDYVLYRVEPDTEFGPGLEWFGPLPEPPK